MKDPKYVLIVHSASVHVSQQVGKVIGKSGNDKDGYRFDVLIKNGETFYPPTFFCIELTKEEYDNIPYRKLADPQVCTLPSGERGEFTGYVFENSKYHISLYNGRVAKLDSLIDVKFDER